MKYTTPGQHRSIDAFRQHVASIDAALGCDERLLGGAGPLGQPAFVHGRRIGNRWAIHPMEGWDGTHDGLPSELTLRRWRNFGRSGAKLIWGGEAFAVGAEGRANPRQLFHNPAADTARGLAALRDEIIAGHREQGESTDDLFIGLQLTHSGRFARPWIEHDNGVRCVSRAAPRIVHAHPLLDQRFGADAPGALLTDAELERIAEAFIAAGRLAWNVGFDFVDVKCCHGYLLHELLAAQTRGGRYGGSLDNRTRLITSIIDELHRACPGLHVGVRVSICDTIPHVADSQTRRGRAADWPSDTPYRYGFGVDAANPRQPSFDEPLAFLKLLYEHGVRLVNLSIGSPYYCPHVQRPAAYPPSDGYLPPEDPLACVALHLSAARRCKAAVPEMHLVGSGYSYLQEFLPYVAQHEVGGGHVDFVGIGRMALSYPELPLDVLRERPLQHKRICRTLSDCTSAPRAGLVSGCYPLDPDYRTAPSAAILHTIKRQAAGPP